MTEGQCLCGAHRFALEGPLELNHHCHCGFCRKHHGSGYASLVGVAADRLRWERGDVIQYESSPGLVRESCATCGTPLPQKIEGMPVFVPAGCLGEFEEGFDFHLFVASKAPWTEIAEGEATFDTYPPGAGMTPVDDAPLREPAREGAARGSCLCGEVRFTVEGEGITARHCHCTRCRRARAAAHASNLVVPADAISFQAGQDAIRRYKLPEANYFTQCFCGRCGAKVPMIDPDRKIAVVPLGALDDPTPIDPREHIWTDDVPGWGGIQDDLPQCPGPPD